MIVKKRLFLSFMLILITQVVMTSQSKYYTYLNDFGEFSNDSNLMRNKVLVDVNKSNEDKFNLIDFCCENIDFSISMRIANKSNLSGKTFKVIDSNKKTYKVNNPCWGLVWNYKDSLNYQMLKLSGHNTMLHDILDERSLMVDIINVCAGNVEVLKTKYLKNGVDLYDGYNNLWVKNKNEYTYLYIGNNQPILIDTIRLAYGAKMKIGYFVGPGSSVKLEKFTTKSNEKNQSKLITMWQKQDINNYFASDSIENIEGLWTYLDRNIDETNLKLGGKYQLAIIKDNNGSYNILYYDGAVVNRGKWNCGMIKGRLFPTRFKDNYDLVWYDSSFYVMKDDTYATIEDENIITLYFPSEKGQIRFVKQE